MAILLKVFKMQIFLMLLLKQSLILTFNQFHQTLESFKELIMIMMSYRQTN